MRTLYLIRHGQARGNAQNLYVGWVDVPLTTEGYENARHAARFLDGRPVHKIITSDLARARMTAQTVAEAYEISVHAWSMLRERRFGALELTPVHYLRNYETSSYLSLERCQAANIEHIHDFSGRIKDAYNELVAMAEHGPIAVVCHFGVVREMLVHAGLATHENRKIFHPQNGSVYVLQIDDNGATIIDRSDNAIIESAQ